MILISAAKQRKCTVHLDGGARPERGRNGRELADSDRKRVIQCAIEGYAAGSPKLGLTIGILWVTRLSWSFVAGIKSQAVPGISSDSRSSTDRCWPLPVLAHLNQSRDLDTTAVTMTELHPNRLPICLQIHTSAQVSHNKTFQLMQKLSINHNKEAYFGEFRELKVTIFPSLKDQSQLLAVKSKAR